MADDYNCGRCIEPLKAEDVRHFQGRRVCVFCFEILLAMIDEEEPPSNQTVRHRYGRG